MAVFRSTVVLALSQSGGASALRMDGPVQVPRTSSPKRVAPAYETPFKVDPIPAARKPFGGVLTTPAVSFRTLGKKAWEKTAKTAEDYKRPSASDAFKFAGNTFADKKTVAFNIAQDGLQSARDGVDHLAEKASHAKDQVIDASHQLAEKAGQMKDAMTHELTTEEYWKFHTNSEGFMDFGVKHQECRHPSGEFRCIHQSPHPPAAGSHPEYIPF